MDVTTAYLVFMASAWLAAALTGDALLKVEYESHHDDWIAEGGNRGMFWSPTGMASSVPWGQRGWFSSTPRWAAATPRFKRLFFWYHVASWCWVMGWGIGVVLLFTGVLD